MKDTIVYLVPVIAMMLGAECMITAHMARTIRRQSERIEKLERWSVGATGTDSYMATAVTDLNERTSKLETFVNNRYRERYVSPVVGRTAPVVRSIREGDLK